MIKLIAIDSSSFSPLSPSTMPLRLAFFSLPIFQSDFQFPAFLNLPCSSFFCSFNQRSEPISTSLLAAKHHQVHTKIFLCYFHFSHVIYFPRKIRFVLFNWNPQWSYFEEKKNNSEIIPQLKTYISVLAQITTFCS